MNETQKPQTTGKPPEAGKSAEGMKATMTTTTPETTKVQPAEVKRVEAKPAEAKPAKKSLLPTKKTPMQDDPSKLTIVLVGGNGVGKTTFASQAPDVLFIATEPGLHALESYNVAIETWEDFHQVCAELKEGGHGYKTIAIDTLTNLYKLCVAFFCKKYGVEHVSDIPGFARGYDLVNNHIYNYVKALSYLPYGLFLICHSTEKHIEVPGQAKYIKLVADVPDSIRKRLLGLADIQLYFTVEALQKENGTVETRRVVKSQPTKFYEARDRFNYLPESLILPTGVDGSYDLFLSEFEAGKKRKATNQVTKNGQ